MKRLLSYLFIVFGLGIFVNDHAKANNYCIPKKVEYVFQSIYIFKDCYVYHKEVDLDTFVEFALTHPLQTVGVEKESPLFVEENLKWLKKYLKENNISNSKINKSIKRVKVAKADLSTVKNISSGIWSTFEEKTKINLPKLLKKKETNTQIFNVNDEALKINPTYLKSLNYDEKIKLSKSLYKSANKNFKQKKIIRGCSELYQMSILNAMDDKLFKRAKKRVNKYNCTQYNFASLELNSENVKNAKIICATKSGFSEYRISEDVCNSNENQILNGTDEYYQVLAFIENKTLSKPIKNVNRNYVCSIWQASSFKIVNYIDETSRCTDIFYEDSHQENYKIFSKYINNVISNDKYTSLKVSTKNLIAKKDANKDNFDPDKLKALISKAKNPEPGTYSIGDSDAIVANTISNTVKGCWSIPMGLPATEKNLMVRIKLKLRSDGSVAKSEIVDHQRMNKPGQGFYKVLAESALRAIKLCSPFNVKVANNQEILLKFDARNILFGTPSIEDKKTEIAKADLSQTQNLNENENNRKDILKSYDQFLAKKYQIIINNKNVDKLKNSFRGVSSNNFNNQTIIAKIDNTNLTTQNFINFLNETGKSDSSIIDNLDNNVIEKLLSELISLKLIDLEIKEHNLSIDDSEIIKAIKENKNFLDKNGIFQRSKYENFLLSNNLTAVKFEDKLRKQLLQKLLFDSIINGTLPQKKKVKVAKAEEPKKKEFKPDDKDNDAPIIEIAENITVNDSNYEIKGKVIDKSKKLFVQVDGETIAVKNGKFSIPRFSPIDEQLKIVAIDQWGNKSKPKIVNVTVDIKETIVADKLEQLNPSLIKSRSNKNRVALIIGIEKYEQTPAANFANLDAQYFYEYARKGFGIPKANIKLLVDEEASLIKSISTINKWLPSKIKSNQTELIIFFAGHGLASNNGEELYILPQDSDPDLLSRTALSRTELFEQIIKLNPKSVTMFMDTCYSGISRDEKMLLASARPIRIVADDQEGIPDNFTIFTASKLDQISSGLKEAEHGIFSYYLMKGLEGKADSNQDKKITNGELLSYMNENVSQKAAELGREQNPSLAGDPDKVLISYR